VRNRPTGDRLEFTTAISATNGQFGDQNSSLLFSSSTLFLIPNILPCHGVASGVDWLSGQKKSSLISVIIGVHQWLTSFFAFLFFCALRKLLWISFFIRPLPCFAFQATQDAVRVVMFYYN